jgi:N-acetylglucosaminyldiphosphoundecaprenol N-acetyl-beta-D-mannosaminyltransferase
MINEGRHSVLGVNVGAVDYDYTVQTVIAAAEQGRSYSVAALAVHGVMTGVLDSLQNRRLNGLDLIVPDGQPVRWALRLLHGIDLPDRVYGPDLTLKVLEAAAYRGLAVFFYGSTSETLDRLIENVRSRYPALLVAGTRASAFRRLTAEEKLQVAEEIRRSGAKLVFVGLGCPRQETWAFE